MLADRTINGKDKSVTGSIIWCSQYKQKLIFLHPREIGMQFCYIDYLLQLCPNKDETVDLH